MIETTAWIGALMNAELNGKNRKGIFGIHGFCISLNNTGKFFDDVG